MRAFTSLHSRTLRGRTRIRLLIAGAAVIASPCAVAGLHSGAEYDALMSFYTSTNGAAWTSHNNWGAGDACQGWFGVSCDQDADTSDNTSHVIGIDVKANNLTGVLPPLDALTKLQVFDVGENALSGTIPDLTHLADLRYFYVYSNSLTGGLPTLDQQGSLLVFDADENQLTGPIPSLSAAMGLITFNVSRNRLSGSLPDLSGFGALLYFEASRNQFSGSIPALAPNLTHLGVGANDLTGPVPAAPASLTSASLCPNRLDTTPQPAIDPQWDTASFTSPSPWWATPFPTNRCDEIFFDGIGF